MPSALPPLITWKCNIIVNGLCNWHFTHKESFKKCQEWVAQIICKFWKFPWAVKAQFLCADGSFEVLTKTWPKRRPKRPHLIFALVFNCVCLYFMLGSYIPAPKYWNNSFNLHEPFFSISWLQIKKAAIY